MDTLLLTEADKLNAAIATFNDSFNPIQPFDEGVTYTIAHYGGALLTATESGNASITALADGGATEAQLVTFEPVEGHELTYYLKSVAMDSYFARTGDYNTLWQTEKDEAAQVQIVQLDGRWLGLRFVATGLHAGTDASTAGQLVYSDKADRGNTLAYWFVEPYVTVVLDRVAFNAAIDEANSLLAEMKPGYLQGQYFAEDIAAFRALISNARSAANKAKDQQTLDELTAQLKADIKTARTKAHTEDIMNHTELAAAIQAATTATAAAVAGDCNDDYTALQALVDEATQLIADALDCKLEYFDEDPTNCVPRSRRTPLPLRAPIRTSSTVPSSYCAATSPSSATSPTVSPRLTPNCSTSASTTSTDAS